MTRKEDWNLFLGCTLGRKSILNAFGKVLLFPLMVVFICLYMVFSWLFTKVLND